jgi:hypothetical protein
MFKHDLRRTAAKEMVRLGVSEKVIMQIGDWKTPSMSDRHHVVAEQDLRDAPDASRTPTHPVQQGTFLGTDTQDE